MAVAAASCWQKTEDRTASVRRMEERAGSSAWLWVRIALVGFVLAWILGPSELRDGVPILLVFLVALGLELHFLVGALREG